MGTVSYLSPINKTVNFRKCIFRKGNCETLSIHDETIVPKADFFIYFYWIGGCAEVMDGTSVGTLTLVVLSGVLGSSLTSMVPSSPQTFSPLTRACTR